MITIQSLASFPLGINDTNIWQGVEFIFFSSSTRRSFASPEERESFKFKYLSWYALHHPECFFIACNEENRVEGYICGVPDSRAHADLSALHPWFDFFSGDFSHYPAHLHINCAESARGIGLGSRLLAGFEDHMKEMNVNGVHLVTSPEARNVGFYDKNGYSFRKMVQWKGVSLLFMGKPL